MTILRVLAFLIGLPLLVLGLIRLVQTQAAQQSAREHGDARARRAADARTTQWALLMVPGALLIQWGMHPLTDGRTLAMIVGCAAVFAIAATLLLQWRRMLHGDRRGIVGRFFLSGMMLGDSVASAIGWHGVRYATILLLPILFLLLGLGVVLRRASAS